MRDPTKNAIKSVTDVTVMETPACLKVAAICSSNLSFLSAGDKFFQQETIINISSTPIPSNKNGKDVCTGP